MEKQAPPSRVEYMLGSRYEIGRLLGQGATSTVNLARDLQTGRLVAVKMILKYAKVEEKRPRFVENELGALTRCQKGQVRHPNIIELLDALQTQTHVGLILEYVDGVDLWTAITQARRQKPTPYGMTMDRVSTLTIFAKLVSAVIFLHDRSIAHRDIKPSNVILGKRGEVKLLDFGFAFCSRRPVKSHCGSIHYVAPEVCRKQKYDPFPADVWSLGVLLFVLICGYLPFNGPTPQATMQAIMWGQYDMPDDVDKDLQDLIMCMLCNNPADRLSPSQLLQHSAFRDVRVEVLPPPAPPSSSSPMSTDGSRSSDSSSSLSEGSRSGGSASLVSPSAFQVSCDEFGSSLRRPSPSGIAAAATTEEKNPAVKIHNNLSTAAAGVTQAAMGGMGRLNPAGNMLDQDNLVNNQPQTQHQRQLPQQQRQQPQPVEKGQLFRQQSQQQPQVQQQQRQPHTLQRQQPQQQRQQPHTQLSVNPSQQTQLDFDLLFYDHQMQQRQQQAQTRQQTQRDNSMDELGVFLHQRQPEQLLKANPLSYLRFTC
eukprot:g22589.t1